ncbi:GNAT family N-acetyltransferase [Actinomadura barringtoniae]|uniref:GNAT family N-acetyltransferase n=1 Tax=Actinomadura barringtoniae TaxID=1427535 RepID=A0A939T454_9ACTN|nr:GNAT family N-acetyltransferase [Actinomadura barringtoniae]MBO2447729.1 GNAT family N-acetyltransferase [Actinomadura barringtoniae]
MSVSDLVEAAAAASDLAQRRSRVVIRELTAETELRTACDLTDRVWRPQAGNPLMTMALLRGFQHSGSYVFGAYEADEMVGVCIGFLAAAGLHSHLAGVDGRARGREVGFALKVHQRAWSLERAITKVTWTYDPLVSRNAYFNLAKLGAVPEQYLPDFYGAMDDGVNQGQESDRLLVGWDLTDPAVAAACVRRPHHATPPPDATAALDADAAGLPVVGSFDGARLTVRIPPDIEALRIERPQAALAWRSALGDTLKALFADGAAVTGFTRDGRYLIERKPGR